MIVKCKSLEKRFGKKENIIRKTITTAVEKYRGGENRIMKC